MVPVRAADAFYIAFRRWSLAQQTRHRHRRLWYNSRHAQVTLRQTACRYRSTSAATTNQSIQSDEEPFSHLQDVSQRATKTPKEDAVKQPMRRTAGVNSNAQHASRVAIPKVSLDKQRLEKSRDWSVDSYLSAMNIEIENAKTDKLKYLMRQMPHCAVLVAAGSEGLPRHQHVREDRVTGDALKSVRGAIVSSFTTVTLGPPAFISFNLKEPSETLAAIKHSHHFSINFLLADPDGAYVAQQFLSRPGDHLAAWEHLAKTHRMPVVGAQIAATAEPQHIAIPRVRGPGVVASLVCKLAPEKCVSVGDHTIVVAQVLETLKKNSHYSRGKDKEQAMLMYSAGQFRSHGPAIMTPETISIPKPIPQTTSYGMKSITKLSVLSTAHILYTRLQDRLGSEPKLRGTYGEFLDKLSAWARTAKDVRARVVTGLIALRISKAIDDGSMSDHDALIRDLGEGHYTSTSFVTELLARHPELEAATNELIEATSMVVEDFPSPSSMLERSDAYSHEPTGVEDVQLQPEENHDLGQCHTAASNHLSHSAATPSVSHEAGTAPGFESSETELAANEDAHSPPDQPAPSLKGIYKLSQSYAAYLDQPTSKVVTPPAKAQSASTPSQSKRNRPIRVPKTSPTEDEVPVRRVAIKRVIAAPQVRIVTVDTPAAARRKKDERAAQLNLKREAAGSLQREDEKNHMPGYMGSWLE